MDLKKEINCLRKRLQRENISYLNWLDLWNVLGYIVLIKVNKESIRMSIEVQNNLQIVPVTLHRNMTLQKESALHSHSKNQKKIEVLDNKREIESDLLWEKGIFVDIYI